MMKTILLPILVCLLSTAVPAQSQDVSSKTAMVTAPNSHLADESRRGWHFYDDPEPEIEPIRPPKPAEAKPATSKRQPVRAPELLQFELLQKRLEEFRNIAIINPSEANVRRYMELEARVVSQASYFADVAQRVAWSTPDLDMTLKGRPVNAQAVQVYDRNQLAVRGHTVAELGKSHVIFFFFRSDCPYCHAFAPTLASFQERYGIKVVPISLDGGGLPTFRDFRRDNGISRTLQVSQVPAVFLAEPFSGKIAPIGFGVMSESELLERIEAVSSPSATSLTPSIARTVQLQ